MISGTIGAPRLRHLDGCLEYGAGLHFVDLGDGDTKPHPAHAQHRVEFGQRFCPAGDFGQWLVQCIGQKAHPLARMRQEFVQGRIKQADADRLALHDLEQFGEVGALHGQQSVQRVAPVL